MSLHVSCWCCSSILVSHTRGGCVAGSNPFTIMTNIFVTEFSEFSETFRENSIIVYFWIFLYFENWNVHWGL